MTDTTATPEVSFVTEVRAFTPEGLDRYLQTVIAVGKGDVGIEALDSVRDDKSLSVLVLSGVSLPVSNFATKYEMGLSIQNNLTEAQLARLLHSDNVNVWAWLDSYYKDSVYPVKKGKVFVGDVLRHVVLNQGSRSTKATHRHLLRAAVNTVVKYGENARFLMGKPHEHLTFEEQIMSRRERHAIAGSREFVDAVVQLYFDVRTGKAKKNAAKGKVGSLMRLMKVVAHLDVNYDVQSLTSKEIISLLPRHEFGRFLPA